MSGANIEPPTDGAKFVLLGLDHRTDPSLSTPEGMLAFQRTEAYEWAKRRGNPQASIPSLQAYKLMYAISLADLGYTNMALAYVKSIKTLIEKSNSASKYAPAFLTAVDVFEDRISVSIERGGGSGKGGKQQTRKNSMLTGLLKGGKSFSFGSVMGGLASAAASAAASEDSKSGGEGGGSGGMYGNVQGAGATVRAYQSQGESALGGGGGGEEEPARAKMNAAQFMPQKQPLAAPTMMAVKQPAPMTPVHSSAPQSMNGGMGGGDFGSAGDDFAPQTMHVQHQQAPTQVMQQQPPLPPPPPQQQQQQQQGMNGGGGMGGDFGSAGDAFAPQTMHVKQPQQAPTQVTQPPPPPPQRQQPIPAAPATAPAAVAATPKKSPPTSGKSNNNDLKTGWFGGWIAKKLNPDAHVGDVGNDMEAYFDKATNSWVFPGEEPDENAGAPPPPPPTGPMGGGPGPGPGTGPGPAMGGGGGGDSGPVDPLAAMMAPPPNRRATRSRYVDPLAQMGAVGESAPPAGNAMQMMGAPPGGGGGGAPPQFTVFKPAGN